MRFIAKVLKDSIHEKFPDATEDELLKVGFLILTIIDSSGFQATPYELELTT